jgi:hypothetical protein
MNKIDMNCTALELFNGILRPSRPATFGRSFLEHPVSKKGQMEHRRVIRFLLLEGLKANDVQTECEQVDEDGRLRGAVKDGEGASWGESTLEMTHRPEAPREVFFLTYLARGSKSGHSFLAKYYHGT